MAIRQLPSVRFKKPEPVSDPGEDAFAFIGGLLTGALIGALLAIFLAPTDGPSLRRRLKATLGMGDDTPEATGAPGGSASSDSAGAHDPLLTPRDVAREEGVAEQRLPAYSH